MYAHMARFVIAAQWHVLFILATLRSGWASCQMVVPPYTLPGSCAAAGISTCCSGDSCDGAGGCQCDSSCFQYSDCCSDIFATCPHYLAPTNVTVYNVSQSAAAIRWSIPYATPDLLFQVTYFSPSLPNSNRSLNITPSVENCTYSLVTTGLQPYTTYVIRIIAIRSDERSISERANFTTSGAAGDIGDTAVVQLRAGPFVSCEDWDEQINGDVHSFFRTNLVRVLGNICKCAYTPTLLSNATVRCTGVKPQQTFGVYTSVVMGTAGIKTTGLLKGLQQWLDTRPSVRSGVTNIAFDSSCPLLISSWTDPPCSNTINDTSGPVINATVGTVINKTSGYAAGRQDVSINILIAAMVAELLVLVAMVMLVTVIVLCVLRSRVCTRHKDSSCTTRISPHMPSELPAGNIYYSPQTTPSSDVSVL